MLKLPIVALLVLLAVVTAVVAQGGIPPWVVLLPLAATGVLASAGASALNNYLDRERDRLMERTCRRPLPAGRIRDPGYVLALGLGLIILSLPFSLWLSPWVAFYTLSGAVIYVVVYTWWLKRRGWWNIVIGGLAGSCAVFTGWFAITPQIAPALLGLALLVFLWTPAHFWSFAIAKEADYRRAGVPMLPVVIGVKRAAHYILLHTFLVIACAFFLYFFTPLGLLYLVGMLLLGGLFWGLNFRLNGYPVAERAWRSYKFSGVYLLLLLLVMLVDILA